MCHWVAHWDVGKRGCGWHMQHFLRMIWNGILEIKTYIGDSRLAISFFCCILLVGVGDVQCRMNTEPSETE